MRSIDSTLQAQVDAQLLEQGAFAPLDLLIDSGRLIYEDYERWRRNEVLSLDHVLMGDAHKIRAELDAASVYARSIGLVRQTHEMTAWRTPAGAPNTFGAGVAAGPALRISLDAALAQHIGSRYVPTRAAPQMDLFLDNPVAALTGGIVRALSEHNGAEVRRLLDRLYAQAPNHADLGDFDLLAAALHRLDGAIAHAQDAIADPRGRSGDPQSAVADPREPSVDLERAVAALEAELAFLLDVAPKAKRLLGLFARDLLTPLWRRLADALEGLAFSPLRPDLHRSHALAQAHDWAGVAAAVRGEAAWHMEPILCARLAESAFYRQDRVQALAAWSRLCWLTPAEAANTLEQRRTPDSGMITLWQRFMEAAEELADEQSASSADGQTPSGANGRSALGADGQSASSADGRSALGAAEFTPWILLQEPGLGRLLRAALPSGDTPAELNYRCIQDWIDARRQNRREDELGLRRRLQAAHPALFACLKKTL